MAVAKVWDGSDWVRAIVGAKGPAGEALEGSSYVFVAGNGTESENGTELQDAYAAAKALTPYGNALADNNRAWVIVAPGIYDTFFVMDEQFVNVVSLDGETSVYIAGISITADNVLARGIDVGSAAFLIENNLAGLVLEKCNGGNFSFGYDFTVSGTFKDCTGGNSSFATEGVASGTFLNCTAGDFSFARSGTASGTFKNCTAGEVSFGGFGTASGNFVNCTSGKFSFGNDGNITGTFIRCTGGGWEKASVMTPKIFWCQNTDAGFETLDSGGVIRMSLDNGFNIVNEDDL